MIPKIIHYCWFGGGPLPELTVKCIESWKKYCPDYEIRRWDENSVDLSSVSYMREAYEEKMWGFVPDVVRLQVVLECGGIYLDTDVEVCRSFDPLLSGSGFMAVDNGGYVSLGLGFGAEAQHPLVQKMLDDYNDRHFRRTDGSLDKTPSPHIQTALLAREGFQWGGNGMQMICGVAIYPPEYFDPISYKTGLCVMTENTYSIHHYTATWHSEEERRMQRIRWDAYKRFGPRLGGVAYRFAILPLWLKVRIGQHGFLGALKLLGRKILGRS